MTCPQNLIGPFSIFVINNDYCCTVNKLQGDIVFTKTKKPSLKIDRFGNMNEAAQQRYELFLRMWLAHGKQFMIRLQAQAFMMRVA